VLASQQTQRLATMAGVLGSGLQLTAWPCSQAACVRVLANPSTDVLLAAVWSRVLNDSYVLHRDVQSRHGDKLYLLRAHDETRVADDFSELRRLGDLINVTIGEVDDSNGVWSDSNSVSSGAQKFNTKVSCL
jgi:hypothetical protein